MQINTKLNYGGGFNYGHDGQNKKYNGVRSGGL